MNNKDHQSKEAGYNLPRHGRVQAPRNRALAAQTSAGDYASSRVAPPSGQKCECEWKEKSWLWTYWGRTGGLVTTAVKRTPEFIFICNVVHEFNQLGVCGASRICRERSSRALVINIELPKDV